MYEKMESLRDRLSKENKKVQQSHSSGSSASSSSTWNLYQNMSFILKHLRHKITVGHFHIGNSDLSNDSKDNEMSIEPHDEEDVLADLEHLDESVHDCNSPLSSTPSPQHSSSKRKRKRSDCGEFQDKMLNRNIENLVEVTAALQNAEPKHNEFTNLGRQIAVTLQCLPRAKAYEAASVFMQYIADLQADESPSNSISSTLWNRKSPGSDKMAEEEHLVRMRICREQLRCITEEHREKMKLLAVKQESAQLKKPIPTQVAATEH